MKLRVGFVEKMFLWQEEEVVKEEIYFLFVKKWNRLSVS